MALPSNPPIDLDEIYDEAVNKGYTGGRNVVDLDNWDGWNNFPNPESASRPSVLAFLGASGSKIKGVSASATISDGENHDIAFINETKAVIAYYKSSGIYVRIINFDGTSLTLGAEQLYSIAASTTDKVRVFVGKPIPILDPDKYTVQVFYGTSYDIELAHGRYDDGTDTWSGIAQYSIASSEEQYNEGVGNWDVDLISDDVNTEMRYIIAYESGAAVPIFRYMERNYINGSAAGGNSANSLTGHSGKERMVVAATQLFNGSFSTNRDYVVASASRKIELTLFTGATTVPQDKITVTTDYYTNVSRNNFDIKAVADNLLIAVWLNKSYDLVAQFIKVNTTSSSLSLLNSPDTISNIDYTNPRIGNIISDLGNANAGFLITCNKLASLSNAGKVFLAKWQGSTDNPSGVEVLGNFTNGPMGKDHAATFLDASSSPANKYGVYAARDGSDITIQGFEYFG